jgi:hypothetical protein
LPGIFIYTLMASELIREGITPLFILKLTLAGLAICPDSGGEKICPLSANRDITDTGSR